MEWNTDYINEGIKLGSKWQQHTEGYNISKKHSKSCLCNFVKKWNAIKMPIRPMLFVVKVSYQLSTEDCT